MDTQTQQTNETEEIFFAQVSFLNKLLNKIHKAQKNKKKKAKKRNY